MGFPQNKNEAKTIRDNAGVTDFSEMLRRPRRELIALLRTQFRLANGISRTIQDAGKRRMLPVLDLDPAPATCRRGRRSRGAWRPVPPGPSRQACRNQVRPDLALFEVADEDPVDAPRQQPRVNADSKVPKCAEVKFPSCKG